MRRWGNSGRQQGPDELLWARNSQGQEVCVERKRCWEMEVTGLGGRRSDRQMRGMEERRHMWRKRGRTRERWEGRGCRGMVWSKCEAEVGSESETVTCRSLLYSQMCKRHPPLLQECFVPGLCCWAAASLCDTSVPLSGWFSALAISSACNWPFEPCTVENLHSQW